MMLYIKDPIGRPYYSHFSEIKLYRDNIAQSAYDYQKVKLFF